MWSRLQHQAATWRQCASTFSSQARVEPQSTSSNEQPPVSGRDEPQALTERERLRLRAALLGKLQEDPDGFSALFENALDTRSQRDLFSALAEGPGLSRKRLAYEPIHAAEKGPPEAPRFSQLMSVAVTKGIPFVAFGLFDNLIMITAGEQIDVMFGAQLGLSSMAAAGLGNTIADVVGINISHSIESRFKKVEGFAPKLTKAQWAMPQTKRAKWLGCAIGMATGCLLGLTPLLFLDSSPRDHEDGKKSKSAA